MRKTCWKNGQSVDKDIALDRALQFGDGLFETILITAGEARLFEEHIARLMDGCNRLAISFRDIRAPIETFIKARCADIEVSPAVIKLVVTRGCSERGYALPQGVLPNWWVTVSSLVTKEGRAIHQTGTSTRICNYRISQNRFLAGIKHLNRLDQVMCSRELNGEFDLVVCDQDGWVIEGIRSNLLLFDDAKVYSPDMRSSGVAGVGLGWLKKQASIQEVAVKTRDLPQFSSAAFVNSVFGVVPIRELNGRKLRVSPELEHLQSLLGKKLGYF